jgi:hypothetical protein
MQRYITVFGLCAVILFSNCSSTEERESAPTQPEKKEESKPVAKDTAPAPTQPTSRSASESESTGFGSADKTIEGNVGEVPPFAIPGQCFQKIYYPATYKELEEQIVSKPEEVKIETIPAKYEDVPQKVVVREASSTIETIPPVYAWVEEKVVSRPAYIRKEEVPPTYETIVEKVVDKEGYSTWKKDEATGLMCLVEVPPTYKEVSRQIVRTPAFTREIEVPAEYMTVRKQIEKVPASTRKVEIPAEYKTIYTKKMIEPEKQVKTVIPAEYKTITKTVIDKEARTEWVEVLCETNTTKTKIQELEEALQKNGYDPGTIDGLADKTFFDALQKYQKDKNLRVNQDKYVYIETVRSLGVTPK